MPLLKSPRSLPPKRPTERRPSRRYMPTDAIRHLAPTPLWNCFADLNAVPRPSKREQRVVAFVRDFATRHGLHSHVDSGGNVVITKPATADRLNRPPVILQAHLDMVHKAAAGFAFDFDKQGIEMEIDGDWVRARGTTLGADNGLGVASILAVLASTELSHPPIEALFTIDEEQGMSGALALQPGLLTGKTLLNLDSEEDDTFTIGCAGGIDTVVTYDFADSSDLIGGQLQTLQVSGLRGGHSGLQIHEGRANAIKLMVRLLEAFGEKVVRLSSLHGGSARNAIPAECVAQIVILDQPQFDQVFQREVASIRSEFELIEPNLQITQSPAKTESNSIPTLSAQEQRAFLLALQAVTNGVYRMSPVVPGLVEASSNLSTIALADGHVECTGLQRSSVESSKHDVAAAFAAPFLLLGATVQHGSPYPGWSPSASSPS